MSTTSPHARGVLLMVIAPVLWSTAGVVTRHLEAASGFESVFWRSSFCAVAMVILWLALDRRNVIVKIRNLGWVGWVSGLLWAAQFTCFMLALTQTTVANTLIFASLTPLFASLFARAALNERIARRTWGMVALALVGIGVMFGADTGGGKWLGNLIALAVPIGAGLNWTLLRKHRANVDLIPAVALGGLLSAALTLPLALPFQATAVDLGLLAGLGFFQLALPCALSVVAARALSPTEMGLLALIEVLLGPLWAWLGAGERPASHTLLGGAIVLSAMLVEAIARGRVPKQTAK